MIYNPEIHHRRSIRLKEYDYSQQGLYFITICTKDRLCFFGRIENEEMILNQSGQIANKCILAIPDHFPQTRLHQFIVMPNHVHFIVEFVDVGANNYSPLIQRQQPQTPTPSHILGANKHFPQGSDATRANNYSPLLCHLGVINKHSYLGDDYSIFIHKSLKRALAIQPQHLPYY